MEYQGKEGFIDRQTIKHNGRAKEIFCPAERQKIIEDQKKEFSKSGGKIKKIKITKEDVFKDIKPRYKKLMKTILKNKTSAEKRSDYDD